MGGGLVVLAAAMAGCALLGMAIERLAYRRLRQAPTLNVLIAAIGSPSFSSTAASSSSERRPDVPGTLPVRSFSVGGVVASSNQLVVILVAAVLMVALQFIVFRTRIGTAMRAVSLNPRAAQLVGVNNDVVISFTFGLGSALAGPAASSMR